MKYNGYLIVTDPDYEELIAKGEVVDDVWCGVYNENDVEQKHMLDDFNIVRGGSFKESSKDAIEKAIQEIVEEDDLAYRLVSVNNELNDVKGLLGKVVSYMGETFDSQEEFVTALKESVGITEEEITNYFGMTQDEVDEGIKLQ